MRRKLFAIAVVVIALAGAGSSAHADSALVGYWKMDAGAGTVVADSSGLGNNGALSGNVSWVPGVTGSGLRFNGTSGFVSVPDGSSLEPLLAVSVGVWFRHRGSPGDWRYILAKGGAGCTAASYGLYTGPGGGLEFYVSHGHGTVYARSPDAGLKVWDGNWHLAVGTYDGTTIRLYIDGAEVGAGTVYPGSLEYPLASSNDLFIGTYPQCRSQNYTFLGDLDDVTVWSQALSASTVKLMAPGDATPPAVGGSSPGQGSGGASGGDTGSASGGEAGSASDRPALQLLAMNPARFAVAGLGRRGRPRGSAISYVDTKAARSTFEVLLRETGVQRGSRCVRPGRGHDLKRGAKCHLDVAMGTFTHSDRAGFNGFRFGGQLGSRRLGPGSYLLEATPSLGQRAGATASVGFQIIS